jgi:putative hydrolase of HD superfamily
MFDATYMRRWNDKICPVELRELDKQAHKMIIAHIIGRLQERQTSLDWLAIIKGGIFEFLQRLVLTDIKPQIFHKIEEDKRRYRELNRWVYQQLEPTIQPLGQEFLSEFKSYLSDSKVNLERQVLRAAHFYATKWEFNIIERANPNGYEIDKIKKSVETEQEKFYALEGIKTLALSHDLNSFIDLCGELRFQMRWSHIGYMVPRTSVLGHMFIVALLSYFCSREMNACPKRTYNNFFTGLFHDLPEVLTRDVISPVKMSVRGLDNLIKQYEARQMQEEVYPLLLPEWHSQIRVFTENEFSNIVTERGKVLRKTTHEMAKYNNDKFDPRDGELVLANDHLAAFLEARLALDNGLNHQSLKSAVERLSRQYTGKSVAGINFGNIYADFA